MKIENRSHRGMLVEVEVKSFIEENLFGPVDDLKEILQDRLNSNLKFETNVSDSETSPDTFPPEHN